MPFLSELRFWVCQDRQVPNYPILAFDLWFKRQGVDEADLLAGLDSLQEQLDTEAESMERKEGGESSDCAVQHQYWCFYCAQLRAHYRMRRRQRGCQGRCV